MRTYISQTISARYFCLLALCLCLTPTLRAQEDLYNFKPKGHETNKALAAKIYEANLIKFKGDTNILVLPGLVADKQKRQVEVMVESTGLAGSTTAEFTVIGVKSDHAYESLLIAFATPSAVDAALKFIGGKSGAPVNPEALRFWSKGDIFNLSIVRSNQPPVRLEKFFIDRRTDKTLPEDGFRFVGSRMVPAPDDAKKRVYAADFYQPVSIVSLFNSDFSVLEIPGRMPKEEAYQNMAINPEIDFPASEIGTLLLQPVAPAEAARTKTLVLHAAAGKKLAASTGVGLQRLNSLDFELRDGETIMNAKPTLTAVVEALAPLDRKRFDYFLTLNVAADLDLGSVAPLARILAVIDSNQGIRIEPPVPGQLYYRAFTPDLALLDRETRRVHPWELALSETNGVVSGKLLRVNSTFKGDGTPSALEATETPVASAKELRAALDAYTVQVKAGKQPAQPAVMLVYAPAALRYGQLTAFLELALTSHPTVYVFVDQTMKPVVGKNP